MTKVIRFNEEVIGSKAVTSKKKVLGSSPDKDGFCSLEIKHDKRTASKTKVTFGKEVIGTNATILNNCPPEFQSQ
jgi:hypothetical protein